SVLIYSHCLKGLSFFLIKSFLICISDSTTSAIIELGKLLTIFEVTFDGIFSFKSLISLIKSILNINFFIIFIVYVLLFILTPLFYKQTFKIKVEFTNIILYLYKKCYMSNCFFGVIIV